MAKKKRRKKKPTTFRSKRFLEKHGYHVWLVERYISFIHTRIDMYHFADQVAIRADQPGVLAVQTTVKGKLPEHIRMLKKNKYVKIWLRAAGNRIWLFGWGKFWQTQDKKQIAPELWNVVLRKGIRNGKSKLVVALEDVEEFK